MAGPSKRKALGRGLDALLPTSAPKGAAAEGGARPTKDAAFFAPIEELHPSGSQPRTRFDEDALGELAASLGEIGMLEPILVRRRARGGYEIVAGERRWRAAQRAGLHDVPVFVRELSESRAFEAALVENLQREDLNPLETARAYQRLIDEHDHSAESVAKLIGKDRSTVANALRLLKLPDSVVEKIEARELSEGHGRALLGASDPRAIARLAREAVAKGWSVRETERRARSVARQAEQGGDKPAAQQKSANVRDLEDRLSRSLGARVTVADRRGKGKLQIAFSSYDELDRLLDLLMKP
ncbi:MAG: ParB/RepB/Spo0J family partition protein [Myxococcales bacterium]|nr:ParB/RepB/Spo0J family partition protein [Myxococcales bacterium]